jgi:hypothetical protein
MLYATALMAWVLAVVTGTVTSLHDGGLVASSLASAAVDFVAVDRLVVEAPRRTWLLLPSVPLLGLTADNIGRLAFMVEHSHR